MNRDSITQCQKRIESYKCLLRDAHQYNYPEDFKNELREELNSDKRYLKELIKEQEELNLYYGK